MIYVIMGVCGCGKTAVGSRLAQQLNCEFRDADRFHSDGNKTKMSAGIPLTDEDRFPWLVAIHNYIYEVQSDGKPVVVTCSALKRSYRHILKYGKLTPSTEETNLKPQLVVFKLVFLKGDEEVLERRMKERQGHFMPAAMLKSQLATLEEPDDNDDCLIVNITDPIASIVEYIIAAS